MPEIITGYKIIPSDGGRANGERRLVVVVPGHDLDAVNFTRAIRSLADPHMLDVVLISVVHSQDAELATRRCLATVAALIRDFDYRVETQVIWNRSWTAGLEKLLHPGDLVLCPPEFSIRTGLRKRELLGELIAQRFRLTVRPMPGFYTEERGGFQRLLLQMGYWIVILGIVAGFFVLESDVSTVSTGGVSQILLILLMMAEIGSIYLWTMITG